MKLTGLASCGRPSMNRAKSSGCTCLASGALNMMPDGGALGWLASCSSNDKRGSACVKKHYSRASPRYTARLFRRTRVVDAKVA